MAAVLFRSSESFSTPGPIQYWNFGNDLLDFPELASERRVHEYTPSLRPAQMEARTLITIPEQSELEPPDLPIALDDVVEGTLKDEFVVLTGVFAGDDGNEAIADPAARTLSAGKGTVASAVLKAGGEVKGSITKKKKPKYLVVGHAPGNTKIKAARAAGIKLITVKGLATVLSGSTEAPEEANLHGVEYSRGYQKPKDYVPTSPLYSPTRPGGLAADEYKPMSPSTCAAVLRASGGGGADFLGEASSSAMAVTSPQPDARK